MPEAGSENSAPQLTLSMANDPSYVVFTARDDPREDCIIIGYTQGHWTRNGISKAIYFRFTTTQISSTQSRTTVTRDAEHAARIVAYLDWDLHVYPGMFTIGTMQTPMSYLNMRNPNDSASRLFEFRGQRYEWRKLLDLEDSYDLFDISTSLHLAEFRREARDTPIGPTHALMKYIFDDDDLLLYCLIALCLNRWTDMRAVRTSN